MATVEELEEQIFDTITSLRNSKKKPNEDTIYYTISKTKTTKSPNKETLREALSKLVGSKKMKVKLYNGKNLYYTENDSFHKDKNRYQEIAIPQDDIETPKRRTLVINDIGNNDEIYDLHKYVQSLATEMEAMKLFIKEQFCLLTRLTIALLKPHICSVSILNFYCKKTRLKTLS